MSELDHNDTETRTDRRKFLKISGATAAGVAGTTVIPTLTQSGKAHAAPSRTASASNVWVNANTTRAAFYSKFLKLMETVDTSWISANDTYFIKLALNSGFQYPATTDPKLLYSMLKFLKEEHGVPARNITVGDQSGLEYVGRVRGSSERFAENTGLMAEIKAAGVKSIFPDDTPYNSGYFNEKPEGSTIWPNGINIANIVREVDHIIYLPRVSHHVQGDITNGLKLGVGLTRIDSRADFHQGGENFYAMYSEIADVPSVKSRLRLLVSSATEIQTTFGPDFGYKPNLSDGMMIASNDMMAHELICYSFLKYGILQKTPRLTKMAWNTLDNFRNLSNVFFVSVFMLDVPGRRLRTPRIAQFRGERENLLSHPAIRHHMRRNGNISTLTWNVERGGPSSIVNAMRGYLGSVNMDIDNFS